MTSTFLGTAHSSDSLARLEFLARDKHPLISIDLGAHCSASDVLRWFSAGMGDIAVVCNNRMCYEPLLSENLANASI
jgi:hypothetical protein